MAIFGIPTHEDDPERAILAAIEMQQGMEELSGKFEESMGASVGLSVGINTGMVVIGDIGTNLRLDYTVIGDVVNTGSRLQQEAESGEILVAQETYRRTAHGFDFQVLEPVTVRGKSRPLLLYKVIQQKDRPLQVRGIEGHRAPLIGREEEFAACKQVVDNLLVGKGGKLLITGEAGLGKSRLAEELKEYAVSRGVMWLEGRCVSYSRSINYWVFVDALRNYFDIRNEDSIDDIDENIKKGHLVENVGESVISTIGSLLSSKLKIEQVSDDLAESERKMKIFTAVRDLLIAESQTGPLILMLEDLHWADELSMELLLYLMRELSRDRIAFVCIYRPMMGEPDIYLPQRLEEDYSRSRFLSSAGYTRVILDPLSSDDSDMLLRSLLEAENLPSEMKSLILNKAGGNPLYLEEVIRSIIDDKAIEHRDGKWLAIKEIEDIEVPGTVQDVIMARIDRLGEEPKNVLHCASVIGRSFDCELLSYLINESALSKTPQSPIEGESAVREDDLQPIRREVMPISQFYSEALDKNLEILQEMGFISRESGGKRVFRFRHILIQDVTYGTILRRRCRTLHEIIGHYIESVHPDELGDFYEILAYHYSNSNDVKSALSYLIKAGNKNRNTNTGSTDSAIRYFLRALNILEESSIPSEDYVKHKQEAHIGLGDAYADAARYEMALSSFETVLELAEQTNDDLMRAEVLRKIGGNKDQTGDWESALEDYEKSLAIAKQLGDHTQIGLVYNNIGGGYFLRGKYDEAIDYFRKAVKSGEKSGDLSLIGDASNSLGMISSMRHDFDEAIKYHQLSLQSYRELGDIHYEAQAYHNLGITHFKENEMQFADTYYEESLKISEKCGYSRLIAYTYLNKAELYLWQQKMGEAIECCKRAFQILQELDDKWAYAEGYKYYGMIYRRQGNLRLAEEAFQTSLEFSRECDYSANIAEVYCEMGLMCEEAGTPQKSLEYFEQCRAIFEELKIVEEVQKIDKYISEIEPEQAQVEN